MIFNNKILILIIIILIFIIIILDTRDNFEDINVSSVGNVGNDDGIYTYEKNKTLLYGSLFLDKLNEQIKQLTDPKIEYESKRIDIIKYSDMLL